MKKEEHFGYESPSLKIGGLSIWIGNTNISEPVNQIFGNSVNVAIEIEALNSKSYFERSFFTFALFDYFNKFQKDCIAILSKDQSLASLALSHGEDSSFVPSFYMEIQSIDGLGHISLSAESRIPQVDGYLTTGYRSQFHKVEFQINQSYLPGIIQSCDAISKHLNLLIEENNNKK